jgi:hypothetical protein
MRPSRSPVRFRLGLVAAAVTALVAAGLAIISPASAADGLLSQSRPATASSSEGGGYGAGAAFDGSTGTRWSSAAADPQWIQVDLGATYTINRVRLVWEAAYGSAYQIQTSPNGTTWTNARSVTGGNGGEDDNTGLSASARYVRIHGTTRATAWGYSLFTFEVYGS